MQNSINSAGQRKLDDVDMQLLLCISNQDDRTKSGMGAYED